MAAPLPPSVPEQMMAVMVKVWAAAEGGVMRMHDSKTTMRGEEEEKEEKKEVDDDEEEEESAAGAGAGGADVIFLFVGSNN